MRPVDANLNCSQIRETPFAIWNLHICISDTDVMLVAYLESKNTNNEIKLLY
jgi:hypothetical protein